MNQTVRVPLFLLDGPEHRAAACRQVLDLVGLASAPFRGQLPERAILLVDPSHPEAEQYLKRSDKLLRVLLIAENLGRTLDEIQATAKLIEDVDAELELKLAERVSFLARVNDLRTLIELSTAAAIELSGARAASVLLVDKDATHLEFLEVQGSPHEALRKVRVPLEGSLAGWVVQHRQSVVSNSAPDDRRHFRGVDALTGERTENLMAVPLMQHREVIGVLEVINRREGFSPQHVAALSGLAPHVVTALGRLRGTLSPPPERKPLEASQVEGAIRKAKVELEQTIDALPSPLALMDGFVIRRANQAYAMQVNTSVQSLPGSQCHTLWGRTTPCPGCPLLQPGLRSLRAEVEFPDGRRLQVHRVPLANGSAVVRYEELAETRDALEAQQRRATLVTAGQLASVVAQEFSSPLTQLRNHLKTLRQQFGGPSGSELSATLSQADAEALRLAGLLYHLRDMGQFVEFRDPEPFNVGEALATLIKQESERLPGVAVQAEPGTVWVKSSITPLRWGLQTLVRSTIQSAAESRHSVTFSIQQVGDEVIIGVVERGAHLGDHQSSEGGLSLTLACHILRGIGGRVEVGLTGEGTAVQISFPACTAAEIAIGTSQAWLKEISAAPES